MVTMTAMNPNQGSEKRGDVMLQLGYSCMGEKNMYVTSRDLGMTHHLTLIIDWLRALLCDCQFRHIQ
jgi:hypothetical protein